MLVKLSFKLYVNYNNSKMFWKTHLYPYHTAKENFTLKKYTWPTMSLYKSGTSNLPQVFVILK